MLSNDIKWRSIWVFSLNIKCNEKEKNTNEEDVNAITEKIKINLDLTSSIELPNGFRNISILSHFIYASNLKPNFGTVINIGFLNGLSNTLRNK
ncbi:hypothetical protein PBPRB1085 [Photobacterium profundum SS9]|uniref:Uncharacterized protein n=1 Tax=Photobacterium profundum (strain SS9) TaxID=298386 RepID=Q6LIC3_PHOPR|nr:hypothetical protein PBPRB1085 [Photobacterium profundum SS9]